MRNAPRRFGSTTPSKAQQRVALHSLLVMRRTLDGLNVESLSRTHGLPVAEVSTMLAAERARREARA